MSFSARLKPLGENGTCYRIVCGRPVPCPGLLGYAEAPPAYASSNLRVLADLVNGMADDGVSTEGRWVVSHPQGFRRDQDGSYRVLTKLRVTRDGWRVGRRPIPLRLRSEIAEKYGGREVVGQFPSLPAIIFCPVCRLPNEIAPPTTC